MAGVLYEREREIAQLDALVEAAARDGAPGVAIVEAPAGAGKSALLAAARDAAARAGARVLAARGVELERSFGFGVARQLAEPLLAAAGAAERARLLAGPAGLAAPLLERAPDAGGIGFGEDRRQALAHGLRWLLANAARERPAVALVDDAHWADEPSLAFLAALAARLEAPVALVVAMRPGEPGAAEELLDRLRAAPGARLLRPAPLGRESVAALVAERLGGDGGPDAAFAEACAVATDGNPFLLGELLEAAKADAIAPTAAQAPRVRALVPETVVRAMLLRFRRHAEPEIALAHAAAVLGERAPLARVAALAGVELADAAAGADRLAASHLLAPGEPVRFVHPIVASAVRADLPAHALARLHGRAAELLQAAGEPAEAVAAHLLHAPLGTWAGAGAALLAGARSALARGDYGTGQRLLERALAEPLSPRERADAEIASAFAEVGRGGPGGAPRLEATLGHVTDPELRAEAHLAVALHAYMRTDYEGTLNAIERGLAEVRDSLRGGPMEATLLDLRTAALALAPARTAQRDGLEAAVAPAGRAPGPIALAVAAAAAATRGAPPATVRALVERVPLEEFARQVLPGSIAASFALTALAWSDELALSERILEVALPAAREAGSLMAFGSLSHLRALVRLRQGRLAEAVADAQPPLALRRDGWETYRSWTTARLAQAHVALGDLDRAAEIVALGMRGDREQLEHAFVLEAAADLAAARGEPASALELLLAAGAVVERWRLRHPGALAWRAAAALAAHRCGATAQAAELADAALAEARAVGAPRALALALRARAAIDRDEAPLVEAAALLRARPAPARAIPQDGAAAAPLGTDLPLDLARVLADLGEQRRRRGAARAAREPLREALALAERCGAAPLAARAHEELRATGGRRVRDRPLAGVDALTPTERRIATLAAAGATNAEIAAELVVTVKTVEWHLGRTYRKLGVPGRRGLAAVLEGSAP